MKIIARNLILSLTLVAAAACGRTEPVSPVSPMQTVQADIPAGGSHDGHKGHSVQHSNAHQHSNDVSHAHQHSHLPTQQEGAGHHEHHPSRPHPHHDAEPVGHAGGQPSNVQQRLVQPAVVASSPTEENASPLAIFEKRIVPIFQSAKPSSCSECHLSGVNLKDYIRPTQRLSEKGGRGWRDENFRLTLRVSHPTF